ncbi:MAG: glycoside hydrolase family 13 protein, partial [Clostridia bacterium]|nr:glycoside hydrolase family 13 protein [Clostridia bacterium]
RDRNWQSCHSLNSDQYRRGVEMLKLASLMQFTLPGVPSIYYGDEAGVQGYRDPFNRHSYPWGSENKELVEWYTTLGKLRGELSCLSEGIFHPVWSQGRSMAYIRTDEKESILVAVNAGDWDFTLALPEEFIDSSSLLGDYNGGKYLCMKPHSYALLRTEVKADEKI